MFIRKIHKKTPKKTYTTVYLARSYREGSKVKHEHVANLSKLSKDELERFEKVLKSKEVVAVEDLKLSNGASFGAIKVVSEIAKRLGIKQALGNSREGKLALFQIAGRIISQGSRRYLSKEWSELQAIDEIFKIDNFNHNDLYKNLSWLSENQDRIEKKIFSFRNKNKSIKTVFLYDVTSSYLEGKHNELADWGYNRDKKKGKKQIVIGLLTDVDGFPISVEVFKGNTGDTKTVTNQLAKLKENFGVERVVFIGDKGMIKSGQIEEIVSDNYKWNYLTTITKQEIKTLISRDVIQLELFEDEIIEVQTSDKTRYILRRNPARAEELGQNREDKISSVMTLLSEQNDYLKEHKRAKISVAMRKVNQKIAKLKLSKILEVQNSGRNISIVTDAEQKKELSKLDGCYVVKTNVPKEEVDTKTAHDRYKALAKVEFAFRTFKTTFENLQPIFVRKEQTTRGHVFVVTLAYMIIKYITDQLKELEYSRKFIFEALDKISYLKYQKKDKKINILPDKLLDSQQKILEKLKIKLR